MARRQFQSLFCERFECPPSEYEARAFGKCLYWHAKLAAPLLRRLAPKMFEIDYKFIHYLGEATGLREISANALDFQEWNRSSRGLRTRLKLRVSGRKAARLAQRLMTQARHARTDSKAAS